MTLLQLFGHCLLLASLKKRKITQIKLLNEETYSILTFKVAYAFCAHCILLVTEQIHYFVMIIEQEKCGFSFKMYICD